MTTPKWILLAEDNAIDAELTFRALNANAGGGKVVLATDGSEALDCLHRRRAYETREAGHPTVVLLDLKMPKVDGVEVLRQIKCESELKHIPVVMFTSSREEADLAQCYELGANAYVVKPVGFAEYRAVLHHIRTFWLEMNELPDGDPSESQSIPSQLVPAG
jgi:CheY-like chemotaxis protein